MSDPFSTFLNTSGAIHIGSYTSGVFAGSPSDSEAVRELLVQLRAEAERYEVDLNDPQAFRQALSLLEAETDGGTPDPQRTRAALETLQALADALPPLAAIVAALQSALSGLLH